MKESFILKLIQRHLSIGGRLILFLDYDGTLVPLAPTPADAQPDSALIDLLTDLARSPVIQTVIVSGRPLASLRAMLPIPRLTLAGLYGVEIERAGMLVMRGVIAAWSRPIIVQLHEAWGRLVNGRSGFLLEDKGLAIALHARWAGLAEAEAVLAAARQAAAEIIPADHFRLLSDQQFLEVVPMAASKGQAVDWFMFDSRMPVDLPIYFGDDDKDEEAFAVVRRWGGVPIGVGERYPFAQATVRVASPEVVREWLRAFIAATRGEDADK